MINEVEARPLRIASSNEAEKDGDLARTIPVDDVNASSLELIQTVQTFDPNNSFVDGGINSPYDVITGHPAYPGEPYYWSEGNLVDPSLGNLTWDGTSGTITWKDAPTQAFTVGNSFFETTVVAVNYNNTGVDKILGSFEWGWKRNDDNTYTPHDNMFKWNPNPSATSYQIIKKDYPDYQLKWNLEQFK